jgi:hypothetical protein
VQRDDALSPKAATPRPMIDISPITLQVDLAKSVRMADTLALLQYWPEFADTYRPGGPSK